MEALMAKPSASSLRHRCRHHRTLITRHRFAHLPIIPPFPSSLRAVTRPIPMLCSTSLSSSTIGTEPLESTSSQPSLIGDADKFEWYEQWYPVMPVQDLDKQRPHGKKVLGIDVVVWWDRNESAWKVMDDTCPHRLAPLSEGRIDHQGRLQCIYHGWCFDGSGKCKLIPQAPRDGPPVHQFKQACVAAVYPSTVQHDIVWFWPNSDPKYKDIVEHKQPPFIKDLDDPTFAKQIGNRDIPYGYEVLIENLMDHAHVPYAHYGMMGGPIATKREKVDEEGGKPLGVRVEKLDKDGAFATQEWGTSTFVPPCLYYTEDTGESASSMVKQMAPSHSGQTKLSFIFFCVPVSPGKSRLIWVFIRNFGVWIDSVVPRWMFHMGVNIILDSDLYLLHVEERKILEAGPSNWQNACFMPTKSDALIVGFRRWLNKYSGGQVDWRGKFSPALPSIPPREQLMDRYWSHVVNCSSCNAAYKSFNALEVALQIASVALLGIFAAMKHGAASTFKRNAVVVMAVVCFATSKWLAYFIHKYFRYHDYDHTYR